jgi:hypothetical protein
MGNSIENDDDDEEAVSVLFWILERWIAGMLPVL